MNRYVLSSILNCPKVFWSIIFCGIWFHSLGQGYLIELLHTSGRLYHGICDFAWIFDIKFFLMVLRCSNSINNDQCKPLTHLYIVITTFNWISYEIFIWWIYFMSSVIWSNFKKKFLLCIRCFALSVLYLYDDFLFPIYLKYVCFTLNMYLFPINISHGFNNIIKFISIPIYVKHFGINMYRLLEYTSPQESWIVKHKNGREWIRYLSIHSQRIPTI